ncbi:hypothetical protein N7493_006568 [Penicillium malachiteum]|uniref:Uncharacterized protein n=1 Tax=Penicillium malachiteum TaxID=1324776 RepID=A0AAD6HKW4_9EURO|nr:hypothetical protein N7493_006568 [Penicillium malachiteum]
MIIYLDMSDTYDHRVWRTGLPVRSAVLKPHAGQLVASILTYQVHTTTGCGKQGFPSAQPYLSHTPVS